MTYDPNLQQRPVTTDPLDPTRPNSTVVTNKSGGSGFLIAGIIIAALVIGGYYFLNRSDVGMSPTAPTPPAATDTTRLHRHRLHLSRRQRLHLHRQLRLLQNLLRHQLRRLRLLHPLNN